MIQKSYLHTLLVFLMLGFLSACKVQKKTAVNGDASALQRNVKKDAEPLISAIKTDYILKDSSMIVMYLKVDFENTVGSGLTSVAAINKKFKTNWAYNPVGGIKEKLESGRVEMDANNAELDGNRLYLKIEIPRLREYSEAILALEFIDLSASRKFTNQTLIDFNGTRPNHRYGLFVNGSNRPTFESFVLAGTPIVFKSINGTPQTLYLKRYSSESPAALSPMSTSKRDDLNGFVEDETISFKSGETLNLSKEGTYVLLDSSEGVNNGFGFLVVNERYPRLTQVEDLVEPLIYMSTNDEIKALKETEKFKESLDLYFLAMTAGKEALAKQIIKSYYRRVEKANDLFTTYKEGWKTDKGMIYLILGPPSRIQRSGQREVWLYAQSANFSEIIFTFYRKQNQFSEDHYELVRYPEYGAYWYPFVEAWRTGSVLE
ncbi:GWxTD domain-containing protein [Arcticibacterium luteifluviistationis]|nr:GWxTD domain-containing protein [Arcticibacterium luteifluviistationis]